ncbi:MAG: putative metal-binding motif-containing protein [Pseudomonadota bacterium]|nr:putative metal-binding motif-containing protein [Pseudomonadota bacterium]
MPLLAPLLMALACVTPPDDSAAAASPSAADWTTVVALLDASCVSCHGPGAGSAVELPRDLLLDLAIAGGTYVVPFDPDASRLWRVLSGELADGDYGIMPEGTGQLANDQIAPVKAWIEGGALILVPVDADGDLLYSDSDCDDGDATVHPYADERCDGVDNDCDGVVDDEAIDGSAFYVDADGDGYGSGDPLSGCDAPTGYAAEGGDCDDRDGEAFPGAPETCDDPVDRNCDGAVGVVDGDADGWAACEECDDSDPAVFPGAIEVCDGGDNDCDGTVDDSAVDAGSWHPDADGDGYGDPGATEVACDTPVGFVANESDCDDGSATISPAVSSDPDDGIDNDCDGLVDEDNTTLSFSGDIQPIFDAECATCHRSPRPQGDLDLSSDGYDDIVGVASVDLPSMHLVSPGEPADSYLWYKVNGTQATVGGSGDDMPRGGVALSAADLAVIESWITAGAAH